MIRPGLFIAIRHIFARRRQSLFTILGLAIGVMVLISAVSMMDGLKTSFIKQMLQVSAHIIVKPDPAIPEERRLIENADLLRLELPEAPDEDTEIKNYRRVEELVASVPGVRVVACELEMEGFIVYGKKNKSAQIHGVVPSRQKDIGNLKERMIAGDYNEFQASPDGAVLGYRLAEKMTLGVGDNFQAVGKKGELMRFKVSALIKTGVTSFDNTHVLVHLSKAQQLSGTPGDRVSLVNISIENPRNPAPVAGRVERLLGREAQTWKETHANVLSLFTMIGRISYFLVVFTMIAAGLGVSNLLTTVILQKSRDIAVLLSMGFNRRSISFIFLVEGVVLGTAGALLGCLLGYLNTQFLGSIPFDFGDEGIISRETLYMNQSVWYYLLSAAFGFTVSLIAGVVPARRASRFDPVEIIRTEV